MSVSPPSPLSVQYLLTSSLLLQLLHMCVMPAPAACPPRHANGATDASSFSFILCLYSFHSLCVCNICMFVLNVPWLRQLRGRSRRALNHAAVRAGAISRSQYDLPQPQSYFFVIFICLVFCAYIIVHIFIYKGILLLYCIKLRKIIYAFTQNVQNTIQ